MQARPYALKPGWPAICLKIELKIVQRESVYATSGFHENSSGRCGGDARPSRPSTKDRCAPTVEGERYTFGDLKVETELEKLSGERLALFLPMQKGTQFRAEPASSSARTDAAPTTAHHRRANLRPCSSPGTTRRTGGRLRGPGCRACSRWPCAGSAPVARCRAPAPPVAGPG